MEMTSQTDIVKDCHAAEELDLLKGPRKSHSRSPMRRESRDVGPFEDQTASFGMIEPVDAVHHARLACSVRPDDRENLAFPDFEAYVRKSSYPVKREKDVLRLQYDF